MNLNKISQIEFSRQDKERNIQLPTKLNEDLAELTGIMLGDGHIKVMDGSQGSRKVYTICVTCSLTEDYDYFHNVINSLFLKNFNMKLNTKEYSSNGYFNAIRGSKAVATFFTKILDVPSGKKSGIIKIPKLILVSSLSNKLAFIRGISDTDFCLTFKRAGRKSHSYPVIKGKFKSHAFVQQLNNLLGALGFRCSIINDDYYDKRIKKTNNEQTVQLSGKENLKKWISTIGYRNPRHHTKYLIWKEFGFCPPYTTLEQRKQILARELDPYSFYK